MGNILGWINACFNTNSEEFDEDDYKYELQDVSKYAVLDQPLVKESRKQKEGQKVVQKEVSDNKNGGETDEEVREAEKYTIFSWFLIKSTYIFTIGLGRWKPLLPN